jgi:hypothetical protein
MWLRRCCALKIWRTRQWTSTALQLALQLIRSIMIQAGAVKHDDMIGQPTALTGIVQCAGMGLGRMR